MTDPSLVTAVIPVFNAERFVLDAVTSVLDQTYDDVECVVVDDGSTDRSVDRLVDVASRIKLLRSPNRGVAAARNLGVRKAQGRYVAFLDADDVWLRDRVRSQLEVFDSRQDLDFVYGPYYVTDEQLENRRFIPAPSESAALENTVTLTEPIVSTVATGMIRRSAFWKTGGFDERLSTSADVDLTMRLLGRVPFSRVDVPAALYRQHQEQMHLGIAASWDDMRLVTKKYFSSRMGSGEFRRYRKPMLANLHLQLAGGHAQQRRWGPAIRHYAASMVVAPSGTLRRTREHLRRREDPRGE